VRLTVLLNELLTTSNQTITNIDKEIIDYYTEFGKSMGLATTKTGMLYSIVGSERGKKNPLKTSNKIKKGYLNDYAKKVFGF